jgi:hypothetical protein
LFFRIEQFIEVGLFKKWLEISLKEMPKKFNSGEDLSKIESIKNLNLADLRSIFFIGVIGLIFSTFIIIIETMIFKILKHFPKDIT